MRIRDLFILFLSACFLIHCNQETNSTQQKPKQSAEGLDMSRTNAVKNTPARLADDSTSNAAAPKQSTEADTQKDLLKELPESVAKPKGMVFVPGGLTHQGSSEGLPREQPVLTQFVRGFFMDESPVTVAEFRQFVQATKYVTEAEKFGDAVVFDNEVKNWTLRKTAYWEYPLGRSEPLATDDHPVTQVSWNDAVAYCNWAGKRLPTETEWEHAARNGRDSREQYSWGENILATSDNSYKANIWQGSFPALNTAEDGYLYTSPVGLFNETEIGLKDMSGNVWEWCQDWYKSYDPADPARVQTAEPERVMRGGSFMCDPSYCHGYRVSGRSGTTPETGLFHVGFRCVKDVEIKS